MPWSSLACSTVRRRVTTNRRRRPIPAPIHMLGTTLAPLPHYVCRANSKPGNATPNHQWEHRTAVPQSLFLRRARKHKYSSLTYDPNYKRCPGYPLSALTNVTLVQIGSNDGGQRRHAIVQVLHVWVARARSACSRPAQCSGP